MAAALSTDPDSRGAEICVGMLLSRLPPNGLAGNHLTILKPPGGIIMRDRPEAQGQRISVEAKPPLLFKSEAARLVAEIRKIDAALARPAPFQTHGGDGKIEGAFRRQVSW